MLTPDALAQAAWRLEAPNIERTEPSHEPPVQHRGVVRVRTGPNRGIATRDQVRVLTERRRGWDLPFDQRAISGTTLRDLDMGLFTHEHLPSAVDPSVIREGGRSLAEQPSALHRLGSVQRFGAGVPIARRACRENGNPEPIFTLHPSTFGVTVKSVTVGSST